MDAKTLIESGYDLGFLCRFKNLVQWMYVWYRHSAHLLIWYYHFLAGSVPEEQKYIEAFEKSFERYQQEVTRTIPGLSLK